MTIGRAFGSFTGTALMAVAKKTTATTATVKTTVSTSARPSNKAGIQKVVPVSSELGKFVGASQVSRTDAVKKVWEYIKLQNLQNPENKREIFCDAKLKTIFDGKDKVGFTEIARLLSNHFAKSG
ncbi:hypothetical protein Lal_00007749 [Lupinus albus]|uniref:Putative transcription regulator SWI/SNF-BAF60b family n=1 Tax=Lupinus albus TaxID=3870 RepID=A0A6A4P2J9_LUPAL|nr:putative transcription regulator SWI/SNF-BAF60b family [Lupinus albus]KAF1875133.1 hypothetical protein Lal_00007749 [Lupinus albus]